MRPSTFRGAVVWSYLMNGGEKTIFALVTFVLASMLGPSDFGMVSMAMVYILFIQMFLEQGLSLSLIQKKELESEHLDSVFWLVVVAGLGLVAVSIALSRWWAGVNHVPELAGIIRWLSLSIVVESLSVVQRAVLMRDMNFKHLALRSNAAAGLAAIVGLSLAFGGFGVWALVGHKLAEDAAALVLLWRLSPWRPRFRFSLIHLKQLLGFSIASFFGKIGAFVNNYATGLLMGLFFGPLAVGIYRLAERAVNLLLEVTTTPLQLAAFPQFSKLQDNKEELRQSLLSCLRLSATLTVPSFAGLALLSGQLTRMMGPQWVTATPVLKILCVLGIVMAFTRFAETLLPALSRPQAIAIIKWVQCAVVACLLPLTAIALKNAPLEKQVIGIALVQFVIGALIFGPILLHLLLSSSGMSLSMLIPPVIPSFVAAAGAVVVILGISFSGLTDGMRAVTAVCVEGSLAGLSVVGLLYGCDRKLRDSFWQIVPTAWRTNPAGLMVLWEAPKARIGETDK